MELRDGDDNPYSMLLLLLMMMNPMADGDCLEMLAVTTGDTIIRRKYK